MALRLKHTLKNNDKSLVAKIYRDSEWDEWRVKFYVDGKHKTLGDYHTDCVEDAKDTALFTLVNGY
jgi:hypothetical protein